MGEEKEKTHESVVAAKYLSGDDNDAMQEIAPIMGKKYKVSFMLTNETLCGKTVMNQTGGDTFE